MPVISMFYGIIVSMYFLANRRHNAPHIHVRYQDDEAVCPIPDGALLAAGRVGVLAACYWCCRCAGKPASDLEFEDVARRGGQEAIQGFPCRELKTMAEYAHPTRYTGTFLVVPIPL